MANFLIILFQIVSAFAAGAAQAREFNISLGSSLTPTGDPWLSPSGLYAFGFFKQRNGYAVGIYLAGIHEKTVVWTANPDNPPVPANVTLSLSREGLFLLLNTGINISIGSVSNLAYIASASMLDTGNFVLYDSYQKVVWQSFEYPTDTLLRGQRLATGQELISSASASNYSRGRFRLEMQWDGNLVQYPVNTTDTPDNAYYDTGTNMGEGDYVTFNLGDDGHMYLLQSSDKIIKTITNEGEYNKGKGIYLVRLDADGIFRLYFHSLDPQGEWSILWWSTEDKCIPKGICGTNAFCDLINDKAECKCLPGFVPIDPTNNNSLSCGRSDISEDCKLEDANVTHEMRKMENIVWEKSLYGVKTTDEKQDCEKACMDDCLCVAALYDRRTCYLENQPVRYGRASQSSDVIALTKVALALPPAAKNPSSSASAPGPSTSELKKQSNEGMPVYGIVIIVPSTMALVSLFLWFSYRRKMNCFRGDVERLVGNQRSELSEKWDDELPLFSFMSIEIATDNFSDENKLGQGGFGPVHKGKLASGQEIAVKRLLRISGQGIEQFKNEVILISKLQHRNLVKLLGCCAQGDEKILVYEYLPNRSLDQFLFDVAKRTLLDWRTRLHIIEGVAQGLLYLHRYSRVTIIHRDLKASNILLDGCMNPKISDFGIARIFEDDQSLATTSRIFGTYGYISPEYAMDGHFSVKSDVFSFGVVVLEIISGQRNNGFYHPNRPLNLLGYIWNLWIEGRVSELTDPTLTEAPSASEFTRYVQIGLLCVQEAAADRPTMSDVIFMLTNESVTLPDPKRTAFYAAFDLKKSITSEDISSSSSNQLTISQLQGR